MIEHGPFEIEVKIKLSSTGGDDLSWVIVATKYPLATQARTLERAALSFERIMRGELAACAARGIEINERLRKLALLGKAG